jgi:hypothetical protein
MPYRPALHEDDRLMPVLARDGGRQSHHESSLCPACDLFEAVGRQVVALVDDQVTVLAHAIIDHTFPDEALDDGDIHSTRRLVPSSADSADCSRRQIQKRREPFDPLVEQLAPVNEDRCADATGGDQPGGKSRSCRRQWLLREPRSHAARARPRPSADRVGASR